MSLFDLTGKVAIVTGSSRGIGRAIAQRLAEHGAKVVISSRKLEACEEVATELNARHGAGTAIAVAASISYKEALQTLVNRTQEAFGRIDVVVCNAASNPYYGPMAGISDEQLRKILDNNIVSNHWLIGMCAPQMITQGRLHHHRVLHRRAAGQRLARRVLHFQGGRFATGAQPCARVWAAWRARQLHRTGPRAHRLCQSPLGESRSPGATQSHDAAAPHRRARRDCRCCGVPGFQGIELHDRAGAGHRRRRHHLKERR